MNIDFKETDSATSPAIADFLIKFSLFVEGRNYNGAEYSAFVHMTPTDYQKYFCKGRENENPAACALEDWKDVKCTVLDLSGYCSQDEGNVEVSILSREEICNIPIEPYEDDDEYLWNKLIDKAGIPWQEEEHFRKELATNVTNFVANLAADSSHSLTTTAHITCEIPMEKLDAFKAYVESLGGSWQE